MIKIKMLEIKSPWDLKIIDKVNFQTEGEIEKYLEISKEISLKKGLDFLPKERIDVLKKFSEKIKNNLDELAELASLEGGKPMIDSLVEIRRGADGVDSCIEILKNDSGSVIPMNIDEASTNRIAFTQNEPITVKIDNKFDISGEPDGFCSNFARW